ncbi:protein O-mannosyl-transferase TMTC3-like [Liolophura sinensis]|uniref:protein O-mannosyl-transferase TMTC3-like n=1 Tax=Liolophura sinensis TaxID=3198878 RepID=UPI00315953D8
MERFNLYAAALCLSVAVCYYNSLDCGFVFDDMSAVVENKDLRPHVPVTNLFWNDFWGTPMQKEKSHKSYRPLCVLTFRLNYAFHELEPIGYHLVNVVLHAAVCVILLRVYSMFLSDFASFIAALLFAVHPIHTEAVTGVVGRAEMLSAIFYLGAMLTYARCSGRRAQTNWPWLALTVVLVTVAMLCKEVGITVIGVCCVYEVFIAQQMTLGDILDVLRGFARGKPYFPGWLRNSTLRAGFLVCSTLLLLFARIKVMGAQLPIFTRFDNPASVSPTPTRHLTFNYLLPVNMWLLLFPSDLCCDWTMGTIPLISSITDPRNLATLTFYGVLFVFIKYCLAERGQRNRAIIMCLTLMALPFIPASNLFFPVGFVVAERILYTPSMGFCMLVALGYEILLENKKHLKYLLLMGMAFMVLTHSVKTVVRNKDWMSELSIFQAALRVNKRNAKLWNNVGHALEKDLKYHEALEFFTKAAQVQPDDIGAHINVGRTYKNLNLTTKAETAYRAALDLFPPVKPGQKYTARIAPNHLNVFLNLATLISKNQSRLLEADQLYRTAISMRADYIQAYINRGDILLKLGRPQEAQQQYETALKYEEDNADVHYNLGVLQLEQGNKEAALKHFNTALMHEPEHEQSLFNSAILIQELGLSKLRPVAYERLNKLLKKTPHDPKIYFNMAMLATDDKDFSRAEKWLKKAVQLQEDFRSALFNLALLLNNDLKRPLEAVTYLETLLKFHPDHVKALTLMGDININVKKDLAAAEKNYLEILQYDPKNVQASHNLCVVYVEAGHLMRAEKCLKEVLNLAPEEEYIQNHLNIVRSRIYKIQQEKSVSKNPPSGASSKEQAQPSTGRASKKSKTPGN